MNNLPDGADWVCELKLDGYPPDRLQRMTHRITWTFEMGSPLLLKECRNLAVVRPSSLTISIMSDE